MIGLVGPQRVGKTTLARAFATKRNIPFIETDSAAVFEALELDPKADYDFDTRLYVQHAILDEAVALYSHNTGLFITDRTPIDMLAYTMADIQRSNVTRAQAEEFAKYTLRCHDETNRRFACLTLIQPGIPIIEEKGKAPGNLAYMEHLNALILGLMVGDNNEVSHYYLPRATLDLKERVKALEFVVAKTVSRDIANVERLKESGMIFH